MDGNKFDQLTKSLASGVSRRQMIKGAAGGAVAAVGAMFGARHNDVAAACRDEAHPCEGGQACCEGLSCVAASGNGASERCCPPGQGGCGQGCCGINNCCNGVCLSAGQCCTAATCPTPSNPCKVASCSAGACGETNIANGTACNDGNACTSGDTCQAGVCTGGTATVCSAIDQCHVAGTCDPATGACSNPNKADGASCNDNNACTTGDSCLAGECQGGTATVCTALDQCHDPGTCDTATGLCSNPPKVNGATCTDGNACTEGDTCQDGACQPGPTKTCPDPDQCHNPGTCDPGTGECSNPAKNDDTPCDDGNACTQTDTCQEGSCVGGNPVVCTASDECHDVGVCDTTTGICSDPAKANGTACSDENSCTQTDTCQSGVCTGANPVTCAPPTQCQQAGICNEETGLCSYQNKPDGTACNDGDACTQSDTCQAGACVGANPVICEPLDQCHDAGICNPITGVCSDPAKPDDTVCDDGDACTQTDTCQAGACVGANPIVCVALDQCHVAGTCDPKTGTCSDPIADDDTSCDDKDECTQTDICLSGVCTGTNPVVCTASDQCHVAGTCDPATGTCSNPDKTDGSACSDGDACTQSDSCQSGVCTGSNPVVCTALDDCHVAGDCNPATGACSNPIAEDGISCDDGDACTTDDICASGNCIGTTVVCNASDQCHDAGSCDPETGLCSDPAKADGAECNDGDACTQTDTCLSGACVGGNPVICTASDQCHNAGTCDSATGICSDPPKSNGTSCGDGAFCNGNETCQNGTCAPGTSPCNALNCETCDEANDRCVVNCPAGTQCDGNGQCANICTNRNNSVYCPSQTGKGFKCCPTDSVCDYKKGVVNCRNV